MHLSTGVEQRESIGMLKYFQSCDWYSQGEADVCSSSWIKSMYLTSRVTALC